MNLRLTMVILTGAGTAFLLPLPPLESKPTPTVPKVASTSLPVKSPAPLVISADENREAPFDLKSIARMDRDACLDALDSQLKRYRNSQPALEQEETINTLTLRLFSETTTAGGPAFPGTRSLPAWLLHAAWLASAKDAGGVPETLRRALPTMPQGWMAGAQIAKSLGAMDAEAALAFEKTMPGDWRKALREARLQGLARVHPLEAVRHTKPNDQERGRVVMTSARKAPLQEVIDVLIQYGGEFEPRAVEEALIALKKRDPVALIRLLEAQGDPHLAETLAKLSAVPDPPDFTGRPLSEVLAAAKLNPKTHIQAVSSAIMQTAVQDADAAISAWLGLEDKDLRMNAVSGLSQILGQHHPAKALAFSEAHTPGSTKYVMNVWLETDAPGALKAIMELPYSSVFRQEVVEELKSNAQLERRQFRVPREDLLLAAQELPPELLRQLQPDN